MRGVSPSQGIWEKGTVIGGRYRVVRAVGQGGMGIVYAVEDLKLGSTLRAMKVTRGQLGESVYSEEAVTLMGLNHPNLPLITDYYSPQQMDGHEILIMDLVEGESLADMMKSACSGFAFPELLHIGLQLCSALHYLHQQPSAIIHRDLKPSNVMIDREGRVKLIDFGISRRYKEGQAFDTVQLGTVGFAAPEQQRGTQSDVRTDIYGLGALLYHMATGGSVMAVRGAEASVGRHSRMVGLPDDYPPAFGSVLERMLQPVPQHRYQTMQAVDQALRAFTSYGSASLDRTKDWRSRANARKPHLVSVLSIAPGAGATLLSISLAFMLSRRGAEVTAAEYFGVAPEWTELLPAKVRHEAEELDRAVAYREKPSKRSGRSRAKWLARQTNYGGDAEQAAREFEQQLRQHSQAVTVIDFSSSWQDRHAMYWLRQSKHVIAVGDPFIAKWQVGALQRLIKLGEELKASDGRLHWIANKDVRFKGRQEWLSLFPEPPLASVPLLPQDALLGMLWSGKWIHDHTVLDYRLNKPLSKICEAVSSSVE
ncbi:protein kinase [Paenibacillus sp. PL2-23]|uniref:serine/threonine protein kinase n=1 Tax=Paenibacillus sp. PL2-23 TaxID=2100729 RepID=UPI0030F545F3